MCRLETCKKLRNGNILIKTKNYNQAEKLVKLVSLSPTIRIEISEHTSLNSTKGVIYSNDLRGIKEEEILEELRNQNVTEVKKILKKENNDSLKETGLIILTFSSISLPTEMSIGCKKCQRYGHIEKICKNAKICPNCANELHTSEDNEECVNIKSCVNCKENDIQTYNHNSYDKKCPIFVREKEIQAIITLEKVDRRKAISTYKERNQHSGPSYSAVTRNNSALYAQTQESPATTTKRTTYGNNQTYLNLPVTSTYPHISNNTYHPLTSQRKLLSYSSSDS
ncbi:uncharacterized protein LOC120781313 [Bactrocera tryoni]|uniref:uncharacterized protein LOC120781313 n=1 Tax=Bactrocera tryoni TaxID=59916 RepID=UPI001A960D79|nr:uncharacterized protein LOC120781313 [Bactrocera tryoni]